MVTLCSDPSASLWPTSLAGEPIMNSPAGSTIISGQTYRIDAPPDDGTKPMCQLCPVGRTSAATACGAHRGHPRGPGEPVAVTSWLGGEFDHEAMYRRRD